MAAFGRHDASQQLGAQELGYLGLAFSTASELSNCACVSSLWAEAAHVNVIWSFLLENDFGIKKSITIDGVHAKTTYIAYKSWHLWHLNLGLCISTCDGQKNQFNKKLSALQYSKLHESWYKINLFYQEKLPRISDTFRPGLNISEWDYFQNGIYEHLKLSIDHQSDDTLYGLQALRILLSIHDGQSRCGPFDGMFGGYSAYNHLVCLKLLDSQSMLTIYKQIDSNFLPIFLFPIAISKIGGNQKIIFINLKTGELRGFSNHFYNVFHKFENGEEDKFSSSSNQLIEWFECFSNRLTQQVYGINQIIPNRDQSIGLSLFPLNNMINDEACVSSSKSTYGFLTRAVTFGIEAIASVIYLPELSQWTYCLSLRLLPPSHEDYMCVEERGFKTCQLRSRHWDIEDHHGKHQHVNGEGVIGQYPMLSEEGYRVDEQTREPGILDKGDWVTDGTSFQYASCSGQCEPGGSFGGDLTFVSGCLDEPSGSRGSFEVKVQRFSLDIPRISF